MQPGAPVLNTDEINRFLADVQLGHDEWQITRTMIGRAGTPWGQYKQCLAEIFTRCEAIRDDVEKCERIGVDVMASEAVCARISEIGSGKHIAARTQAEQGRAAIQSIERGNAARRRELVTLMEIARFLRETLASRTEFPVPHASRRELDTELWVFRALDRVASDILLRGALTEPAIELLEALDPAHRAAIFDIIDKNPARLRDWARSRHPVPGMLSAVQARELAAVMSPATLRAIEDPAQCSPSLSV